MINNIYIFYHILITDDVKSINIVAEQLNNLMISNLLSVTKKLFIGVIYGGKDKTVLDNLTDLILKVLRIEKTIFLCRQNIGDII